MPGGPPPQRIEREIAPVSFDWLQPFKQTPMPSAKHAAQGCIFQLPRQTDNSEVVYSYSCTVEFRLLKLHFQRTISLGLIDSRIYRKKILAYIL